MDEIMKSTNYSKFDWDADSVKRFWDYYSNHPETYYSFQYGEQILNSIIKKTQIKPSDTTWLDYGCGIGSLTGILLRKNFKTVIWDQSPDSMSLCSEKYKNYSNFLGTWEEGKEANIGFVSLIEVIEHVEHETMQSIVNSLREKCKPGTTIVITTPNNEDLHDFETEVYCPKCDTIRHKWQHVRSFSKEKLEHELKLLGLNNIKVSEENFPKDKYLEETVDILRKFKRKIYGQYRNFRDNPSPNLLGIGVL
jgi:2-polyprenyl-3-methyl-5-hydroxy-6-metoxy-1,4-benzoquinol methylase